MFKFWWLNRIIDHYLYYSHKSYRNCAGYTVAEKSYWVMNDGLCLRKLAFSKGNRGKDENEELYFRAAHTRFLFWSASPSWGFCSPFKIICGIVLTRKTTGSRSRLTPQWALITAVVVLEYSWKYSSIHIDQIHQHKYQPNSAPTQYQVSVLGYLHKLHYPVAPPPLPPHLTTGH